MIEKHTMKSSLQVVSLREHILAGELDHYITRNAFDHPEKLKLCVLAKRFAVCESNLRRFYKARFGCTIHQNVIKARIEKICDLLINSEFSIKEIALVAGYSELANFSRDFCRQKGMAPTAFRMKHFKKAEENLPVHLYCF